MKVNAYGRMLEIIREQENWIIYNLGEGKRIKANDLVIPMDLNENEVIVFLEDIFHEFSTPDTPNIKIIK